MFRPQPPSRGYHQEQGRGAGEGRVKPFPPRLQAEQHGAKFRSSGKAQHAVVRRHDVHVALPLLPANGRPPIPNTAPGAATHRLGIGFHPDQIHCARRRGGQVRRAAWLQWAPNLHNFRPLTLRPAGQGDVLRSRPGSAHTLPAQRDCPVDQHRQAVSADCSAPPAPGAKLRNSCQEAKALQGNGDGLDNRLPVPEANHPVRRQSTRAWTQAGLTSRGQQIPQPPPRL